MEFAKFQSTYKPLPIDVYERTGQELEAKYYKNRESSSLLRQGLSNAKVEDRNIGHLAKVTTDVETMLDKVNNNWQYAGNTLYNAKDRIVGDKALSASLEDYAKSQASKTAQQERLEKGDIGQEGLDAYYQFEKLYNNKAIELDENGQAKNRWITPAPPKKPDIDTKAMKMVDMLLKNPDSVDGSLRTILDSNGMSSGYLEKVKTEGVGADKIFGVVKGFLANSDEVKDYYRYVNNADLLYKTTETLPDGTTTTKSILPNVVSMYRDLGWNVDENGVLLDKYQHYINPKGEFDIKTYTEGKKKGQKIELVDAPKSILESPEVKTLMSEDKLSLEDALKQTYLSHKLNNQMNNIASEYSQFAFSKTSASVLEDKGYWLQKEWDKKEADNRKLSFILPGEQPVYQSPDFDSRETIKLIATKQAELLKMPNVTPTDKLARRTMQSKINDLQNGHEMLINAFNTNDNNNTVTNLYNNVLDFAEINNDKDILVKNRQQVENYITGKTSELGIPLSKPALTSGMYSTGNFNSTIIKLNEAREEYSKTLNKKVVGDGLNIRSTTATFLDADGAISEVSKNIGNIISTSAGSWEFPSAYTKKGEPMTIAQFFTDNNIDPSRYDILAAPTDPEGSNPGYYSIKVIPKKGAPEAAKLKAFDQMVVRPGESIKRSVQKTISDVVDASSKTQQGKDWAKKNNAAAIFGDFITPLKYEIANNINAGISTSKLTKPVKLFDVPTSSDDLNITRNFELVPVDTGYYVYQLDNNDMRTGTPVIHAQDLNGVQLSFYDLFTSSTK